MESEHLCSPTSKPPSAAVLETTSSHSPWKTGRQKLKVEIAGQEETERGKNRGFILGIEGEPITSVQEELVVVF